MSVRAVALCWSLVGSYGSEGANARHTGPPGVEELAPAAVQPKGELRPEGPTRAALALVAVEWRSAEDLPVAVGERLRNEIAARRQISREQVVEQPLAIARRLIAREFPREATATQLAQVEHLVAAHQAFREARFAAARSEIAAVFTSIAAHPQVTGAAARAREAHILDAQVAWASGARAEADAALQGALTLDPEATLSTRRVPPEFAERYASLQARLLASRASWEEIEVSLPPDVVDPALEFEIDGVVGRRPVPPGEHLVVVRRPGHRPQARTLATGETWALTVGAPELGTAFPESAADAGRICEALEIEQLVLAEAREGEGGEARRIGLQVFRCGRGFGRRWVGEEAALATGVELALGGDFGLGRATLSGAWPSATPRVAEGDQGATRPKPWYRRAWVWLLIGAVVAAGVTTGVVLGTRDREGGVRVDAGQFSGE